MLPDLQAIQLLDAALSDRFADDVHMLYTSGNMRRDTVKQQHTETAMALWERGIAACEGKELHTFDSNTAQVRASA